MYNRNSQRLDSDRAVECRANGQAFRGVLYNVSTHGCMIEMAYCQVNEGDRLYLKADGNIRLGGVVTWQDGKNAGVRFDAPLHEAVVRYLGYDPVKAVHMIPVDRFGRLLPKLSRFTKAH